MAVKICDKNIDNMIRVLHGVLIFYCKLFQVHFGCVQCNYDKFWVKNFNIDCVLPSMLFNIVLFVHNM